MATSSFLVNPELVFVDPLTGDPIALGHLLSYEAGTDTPKATYQDYAATIVNPVDIELTSGGTTQFPVRLVGAYKFVLTDSNYVTIRTWDNVIQYNQLILGNITASVEDINSTTTTSIDVSNNYSVQLPDRGKTILVDTSSGNVVITLLSVANAHDGFEINIKKIDNSNNHVTINPAVGEQIENIPSFILYDFDDAVRIHCDGVGYKILNAYIRGTVLYTALSINPVGLAYGGKLIACDASAGSLTMTLDSVANVGRGYSVTFKKTDSTTNTVTILAAVGDTIDGAVSITLSAQYQNIVLRSAGASSPTGTNWLIYGITSGVTTGALPEGYIYGLGTDNLGSNATHIYIQPGAARDATNTVNMYINSVFNKRIDASWAQGNGNGGFPSSLTLAANTWYDTYIIAKQDGTTDAGFDIEGSNASNLLANASGAGFLYAKRTGSCKTDGSKNILNITCSVDPTGIGRCFNWILPARDIDMASSGTSIIRISVPTREVFVNMQVTNLLEGSVFMQAAIVTPGYASPNFYASTTLSFVQVKTNAAGQVVAYLVTTTILGLVAHTFSWRE